MKLHIFYFLIFIQISCATIVRPNGGPSDNIAPDFIKTSISHDNKNYSTLTIKYNENIKIQDPYLIYASPSTKLTSSVKLDKLIITGNFNKTYNNLILLNKAIADINENNIRDSSYYLINNNIADTSIIKGRLFSYHTRKPNQNYLCQLQHIIDSDTILFQNFTDTNGYFSIGYLPNINQFNLLTCYNDKNKNYEHDADESLAFVNYPLTDSLYSLLTTLPHIKQAKSISKHSSINNKQFFLVSSDYKNPIISRSNNIIQQDSLITYSMNDTVFVTDIRNIFNRFSSYYIYEDSILSDSVNITYSNINISTPSIRPYKIHLTPNDSLMITSSTPIKSIDHSKIKLYSNSQRIQHTTNLINPHKISFHFEENYDVLKVHLDLGALIDEFFETNQTDSFTIQIDKLSNYGQIEITTDSNNFKPFIIHLFEQNKDVPKYMFYSHSSTFISPYLLSGIYNILLVQDENQNQRIDGPKPYQQQPEKSFFKKNVNVISTFSTSINVNF